MTAAMLAQWFVRPFANFRRLRRLTHFRDDVSDEGDVLWALRDVSFSLEQGQVLGIVGNNGSGKSTLMKLLAGMTRPTSGVIRIQGHPACLFGIGVGFNPELSGHDNIFINGMALGMRRAEIERQYDAIVAFAELERFIHMPIKRYSSGMRMRLGFAVSIQLEREILLIDEGLAAGDLAFREKGARKLQEIVQQGRTVVMVSHNHPLIARLARRCLWIDQGRIMADGPPKVVLQQYRAHTAAAGSGL